MVLNYHGLYITQEQIVHKVFGGQYDAPAYLNQILHALSGWAPDTRGRYSGVHASLYGISNSQLVADLANNWPLIVGFRGWRIGHAVVLSAVEYLKLGTTFPLLTKAIYRDPWPGQVSKQETIWALFRARTQYMIRIWVTRQ